MHASAVARRRQLRGFVIAWLGITLLMGALTFAGIYYATGLVNNGNSGGGDDLGAIPLPLADLGGERAAEDGAPDLSDLDGTPVPTSADGQAAAVAALPQVGAAGAARQPATPVPSPTPRGGAAPAQPPAAGAAAVPISEDFQLGIQVQPNADPEVHRVWMGEVRDKLKLKWIKQQIRWEDVEPQPGQYDWHMLDVTLDLAAEHGILVMASVLDTPDWAREPGAPLSKEGPPADPQIFANFLTQLLTRYKGKIHAVEVWNEMNIDREWASIYGLSARNYVNLLRVARDAIKAVDPNIIVISGALSPTGVNDGVGAYDDFVYMDMLIQAGVLDVADCVGAHHNGYNIGPNVPWNSVPNDPSAVFRGPFNNPHHSWSFYSTLNGYAQKIRQAGSDKKLCITEFGWAVSEDLGGTPQNFEFARDNTLQEQAQYLGEAIELMQEWGFVWLAFVWNLNYGPQAGWDPTDNNVPYSLLRPEWRQSPAYDVIAAYNFREQ